MSASESASEEQSEVTDPESSDFTDTDSDGERTMKIGIIILN